MLFHFPSQRIFMPGDTLCPVVLIASTASRQGKTLVTCGLARALVNQGQRVKIFKIGPDFLDPGLLEAASVEAVQNLDLWMMGEQRCRDLVAKACSEFDCVLVKSAMGLFDGAPSPAELAKVLGIPVVLVLNAGKYAQTAAALVQGMKAYEPALDFVGVIGNFVGSDHHHHLLSEAVGGQYLGSVRRQTVDVFPERHLGVKQPVDFEDVNAQMELAARAVAVALDGK